MTHIQKTIQSIDWSIYRKQRTLLQSVTDKTIGQSFVGLNGLVKLIHSLEEAAIDDGLVTEEQVYGGKS